MSLHSFSDQHVNPLHQSSLVGDHEISGNGLVERSETKENVTSPALDPSLASFRDMVYGDAKLKQLAHDMFTEIPDIPPYDRDPSGDKQVRDFDHMLHVFNCILQKGPDFLDPRVHSPKEMMFIGFPINAILNWPMNTKAGYDFWLAPEVNVKLKAVLNAWCKFLASPASQACLNSTEGWTSPAALALLAQHGNDNGATCTFDELYVCKPDEQCYGFPSWDAFFTRSFRPNIRPVAAPDDEISAKHPHPTQVIVHSCEAAPLRIVRNVKYSDTFWLKGQPYSLVHMLDENPLAHKFVGGTVYQGFLSALTYHRWHAPVSGRVVRIQHVPGTYYSASYYEGFANPDGPPDPAASTNSQPFLSAVATRGILFMEADNEDIGLMAVVYIGMAEVSSCEFVVEEGQRITKGQQVGMFHFGGSTHCMLFRPETDLQLMDPGPWDADESTNVPVNSAFAVATSMARAADLN